MIQLFLGIFKEFPLKGSFEKVKNPDFTFDEWFSGEYQKKKNEYIKENFPFRPIFVRINNQLDFSIYKKTNAKNVIIGRNNFLFEEDYIEAYFGYDFIGDSLINSRIKKLSLIRQVLKKNNKKLLFILAPGKGSFYNEYFPEGYKMVSEKTNYKSYRIGLDSSNIPHIDFNKWFVDNKNKFKYPLYPKTGIHWSRYSQCLVLDSIIKRIENMFETDLPNISWDYVDYTRKLIRDDRDIERAMNLAFNIPNFKMAYPDYSFEGKKKKLNVIVISDSFFWGPFRVLDDEVFKNLKFWYYNQQVFPDSYTKDTFTKDIDYYKQIQKADLIILMSTEATLKNFPWGFIKRVAKVNGVKNLTSN